MVQLYPASTSSSMPSATSLNTIVWSASGPKTLSKGYVLVVGPPPPYEEAVVNADRDDEAEGVVSIVIAFASAPSVVVMTGDAAASSWELRPLRVSISRIGQDRHLRAAFGQNSPAYIHQPLHTGLIALTCTVRQPGCSSPLPLPLCSARLHSAY